MPTSDLAETSEWNPGPTAGERASRITFSEYSQATRVDSDLGFTPLDSDFEYDENGASRAVQPRVDQVIGSQIQIERNGRKKNLRIAQLIGNGGMGRVYLAVSIGGSHQTMAIKIAKSGKHADQIHARMQTEATVLQTLNHVNVVRFLGKGQLENGQDFIAMDRIDGPNIVEFLERNERSVREKAALFVKIGNAVAYCHEQGIIHRDIKPANVLIDPENSEPILIDFGIAKLIQPLTSTGAETPAASTPKSSGQKTDGQLVGTIQYMSPEQAKQANQPVDQRTDVYSLGVLLFELIAGKPLFNHTSYEDQSFDSIVSAITSQKYAETIFFQKSADWNADSDLLSAIEIVIEKAIATDIDARYDSVNAFMRDLDEALHNPQVFVRDRMASLAKVDVKSTYIDRSRPRDIKSFVRNPVWQAISLCIAIALFFSFKASPLASTCSNQDKAINIESQVELDSYFCSIESDRLETEKLPGAEVQFKQIAIPESFEFRNKPAPSLFVVDKRNLREHHERLKESKGSLVHPNAKLRWLTFTAPCNSVDDARELSSAAQQQAIIHLNTVVQQMDDGSLREVKSLIRQIPQKTLYRCMVGQDISKSDSDLAPVEDF